MTERKETILSLGSKENIAKLVIEEMLSRYLRPAVLLNGSKDSIITLYLVKLVAESKGMKIPPALFIDHGDHFPETVDLLDTVKKEWKLNLVTARNDDALSKIKSDIIFISDLNEENRKETQKIGFSSEFFQFTLESDIRNHLLKTVAINSAIRRYRFDSVVTGIRWDQIPSADAEVFISDHEDHVRVHPILPFLEKDVWQYTFEHKLPVHPKYAEGFQSVEGVHGSHKVSDHPAWEQHMEQESMNDNRSQNSEGMKEKLRALGYM